MNIVLNMEILIESNNEITNLFSIFMSGLSIFSNMLEKT